MKGLLSKELSNTSGFLVLSTFLSLIMGMIFLILFSLSETGEPANGFFTSIYFAMLTFLLAITSFQSDEASKWNLFALTLPIDRKLLVQSKYLFLALFFGSYFSVSLFLAVIFQYFSLPFLWGHMITAAFTLLLLAIFFPVVYQRGLVPAFGAPIFLYIFFSVVIRPLIPSLSKIETQFPSFFYITALVAAVVLYVLSCHLSCRIFSEKDIVYSSPSHPHRKKQGKPLFAKSADTTPTRQRMLFFWHKEWLSLRSTIVGSIVVSILLTILILLFTRLPTEPNEVILAPLNLWIFILFIMLPYHSFRNDETKKWNTYLFSLPVDKNQVVQSKYVFCGTFLAVYVLGSFGASLFFHSPKPLTLWMYAVILSIGLLYYSLFLPLCYSRGKSQALFLVVVAYITLNLFWAILLGYTDGNPFPSVVYSLPVALLLLVCSFALYLLSYQVACRLLHKSDLH